MPKRVIDNGVEHEFPDDFTDAEIAEALRGYRPRQLRSTRARVATGGALTRDERLAVEAGARDRALRRSAAGPYGAVAQPFADLALDPALRQRVGERVSGAGRAVADWATGGGPGRAAQAVGQAPGAALRALAESPITVPRLGAQIAEAAPGALRNTGNAIAGGIDWLARQAPGKPDLVAGLGAAATRAAPGIGEALTYGPFAEEERRMQRLDAIRAGGGDVRQAADDVLGQTGYAAMNIAAAPFDVPMAARGLAAVAPELPRLAPVAAAAAGARSAGPDLARAGSEGAMAAAPAPRMEPVNRVRAEPDSELVPLANAGGDSRPDFVEQSVAGQGRARRISPAQTPGAAAEDTGLVYDPNPGDGSWRVLRSFMDKEQRGRGRGVQMYEELVRRAQEAGVTRLTSDNFVSADADRMYQALARRGYAVKKNPGVRVTTDGGQFRPRGGPVYTVTIGESRALPRGPERGLAPRNVSGEPIQSRPGSNIPTGQSVQAPTDYRALAERVAGGAYTQDDVRVVRAIIEEMNRAGSLSQGKRRVYDEALKTTRNRKMGSMLGSGDGAPEPWADILSAGGAAPPAARPGNLDTGPTGIYARGPGRKDGIPPAPANDGISDDAVRTLARNMADDLGLPPMSPEEAAAFEQRMARNPTPVGDHPSLRRKPTNNDDAIAEILDNNPRATDAELARVWDESVRAGLVDPDIVPGLVQRYRQRYIQRHAGAQAVNLSRATFVDSEIPRQGGARRLARSDDTGAIEYEPKGDVWEVRGTFLDEPLRGQGHGVALYEELINRARAAGVTRLRSGGHVTPDAARMYDALERRGYRVTRTQGETSPRFEVDLQRLSSEDSVDSGLRLGERIPPRAGNLPEDGGVFARGSRRGSPPAPPVRTGRSLAPVGAPEPGDANVGFLDLPLSRQPEAVQKAILDSSIARQRSQGSWRMGPPAQEGAPGSNAGAIYFAEEEPLFRGPGVSAWEPYGPIRFGGHTKSRRLGHYPSIEDAQTAMLRRMDPKLSDLLEWNPGLQRELSARGVSGLRYYTGAPGSPGAGPVHVQLDAPRNVTQRPRQLPGKIVPALALGATGATGAALLAGEAGAQEEPAELRAARERVREMEAAEARDRRIVERGRAEDATLEEVKAAQRLLGVYPVSGRWLSQTTAAYNEWSNRPPDQQLEAARADVRDLEQALWAGAAEPDAGQQMLRQYGPNLALLGGLTFGLGTRGAMTGIEGIGSALTSRRLRRTMSGAPVSQARTPAALEGRRRRAVAANEEFRRAGGGDGQPFAFDLPASGRARDLGYRLRTRPGERMRSVASLYPLKPELRPLADGLSLGGFAAETAFSWSQLEAARQELEAARAAIERTPNPTLEQRKRLQDALDDVAIWESGMRGGGAAMGGYALGMKFLPFPRSVRPPNVSPLENEVAALQQALTPPLPKRGKSKPRRSR